MCVQLQESSLSLGLGGRARTGLGQFSGAPLPSGASSTAAPTTLSWTTALQLSGGPSQSPPSPLLDMPKTELTRRGALEITVPALKRSAVLKRARSQPRSSNGTLTSARLELTRGFAYEEIKHRSQLRCLVNLFT